MTRLAARVALCALALVFCLSHAAAALTDGRDCTQAEFRVGSDGKPPGRKAVWCVVLIDGKTAATGSVVFDLYTSRMWPTVERALKVVTRGDCTAGTISFTTSDSVGGVQADLAATNPNLSLAAGSSNKSIEINSPLGDVLTTNFGTASSTGTAFACTTTGASVIMVGYELYYRH